MVLKLISVLLIWLERCVCVYVCIYLVVVDSLRYTRVVLSPYPCLSSFSFSCTFIAIITFSCSSFLDVWILLEGKFYFFVLFKQSSFAIFSSFPSNIQPLFFISLLVLFFSVSSRLLINLYIVIKCPLYLSFSVVSCISFDFSSYVISFNSGTILVAILCILSNFNTCFFLCGIYITSAYFNFGLIIVIMIFLIVSLSRKWKAIHIFCSILTMSPIYLSLCFLVISCPVLPRNFFFFLRLRFNAYQLLKGH